MKKKDYLKWHIEKSQINDVHGSALFHEREIWWCRLGLNIGYEQDGTRETFDRPVIILAKFNLDTCLVVPLTSKLKVGKYYFNIGDITGRESVVILSQIRLIDRKRLTNKIGVLSNQVFSKLIENVVMVCFPTFHK